MDSPAKPFEAPTEEQLAGAAAGDEWDIDFDDEAVADDEELPETTPAVKEKEAPAKAPAAEPVKDPVKGAKAAPSKKGQ